MYVRPYRGADPADDGGAARARRRRRAASHPWLGPRRRGQQRTRQGLPDIARHVIDDTHFDPEPSFLELIGILCSGEKDIARHVIDTYFEPVPSFLVLIGIRPMKWRAISAICHARPSDAASRASPAARLESSPRLDCLCCARWARGVGGSGRGSCRGRLRCTHCGRQRSGGRCRLSLSNLVLKPPMVSALETGIS